MCIQITSIGVFKVFLKCSFIALLVSHRMVVVAAVVV